MKTSKFNFFKWTVNFSIIIILLMSSCEQSGKNNKSKSEKSATGISVVEIPKMNIQTAIISDNLEIVKQHIEAGTNIDIKDQMSGATPLISAATFGRTAIAKALIDAKADLNIINNDGASAMHVAAFFCRIEIVQLLIDAKANKTTKNNFGTTPRESVLGSFNDIKPFYEMLQQQLGPLGLHLDLTEVEKNRPVIAMMLQ